MEAGGLAGAVEVGRVGAGGAAGAGGGAGAGAVVRVTASSAPGRISRRYYSIRTKARSSIFAARKSISKITFYNR